MDFNEIDFSNFRIHYSKWKVSQQENVSLTFKKYICSVLNRQYIFILEKTVKFFCFF